nr:hypothetical protein [Desulfobacterales bacterium]
STKPPKIDLAAEPEPRLAISDSSSGANLNPSELLAARDSAANPDEDEAIPAAVGKLFELIISARRSSPATSLIRSRKDRNLVSSGLPNCSPFSQTISLFKLTSKLTVVFVVNLSTVTDIDPAAGMFKRWFDLPQYLISAKFGWAIAVAI